MKLFEPFTINGKLSLKNRIVMPALVTRLATEEGEITEELLDRYLLYAKGGTGLIITEAVSVKKQKSGPLLRLSENRFVPALRELTERVHGGSDARIAPQIIHFMKVSRSGYRQKVEDLSIEEIREIPVLFAGAAERARTAGFDAVELHFASLGTPQQADQQKPGQHNLHLSAHLSQLSLQAKSFSRIRVRNILGLAE